MSDREERLTEGDAPQGRVKSRNGRYARDSRDVLDERTADERGQDEREVTEDREISEDERLEMFRDSLEQSVLPELPQTPGYHTCWLTTSNPRDTIAWRMRLGYQLIRIDEMPGWQGVGLKSGDYAGIIGVNEMVAARIPLRLYNRYMKEVHDAKPRSEEEKLRRNVDLIKQQAEDLGSRVGEGDGTQNLVQRAPPMPDFLS